MTRARSGSGAGGPPGRAAALTPSAFIGRYQILEKAGEGGMGALYLARDPAIDRLLAIKVLRHGYDSPELRERFAREARAAGRLRHPNIVTIFDVGEHEGNPFIAMEFLAGETLDELIRERARLSLARRLKLVEELCDGLAYAHRAGIVHRDVKPANLMVDSEGVLKILDFGIVRLEDAGATQAGVIVGSVNYMSPEQVTGSAIDHRSDIFAVGLVAYELLTLRQAFPGTLKDGLFNRILTGAYEPLGNAAPGLDPAVIPIVEQAMQIDPADRYQDLARMRNELMRVRQRLEAAEDQAVDRFAADLGETIIATAPVPTPAPRPQSGSASALDAAERELASGNYRAALTLAGRSAAEAPDDSRASTIMARAQAALLERGRSLESGPVASQGQPAALAAGTSSARAHRTFSYAAAALAAAAVILAGAVAAVFLLAGRSDQGSGPRTPEPAATAAPPPADTPRDPGTESPADPVETSRPNPPSGPAATADAGVGPVQEPASRVRVPVSPAAPPPTPGAAVPGRDRAPVVLRVGRDAVSPPRRVAYVEPEYPAAESSSGLRGAVRLDLTIGRDGRVADVDVTERLAPEFDRAAVAAARRWEFAPTVIDGEAVVVVYPVSVEFTPPARAPSSDRPDPVASADVKPRPSPPAPQSGLPAGNGTERPPGEPARLPAAPSRSPRVPDPQAETAAVRDVLRRYEQAWESRNAEAVARLHALSGPELAQVRATLAGAVEYGMSIDIRRISIDPGGTRATVDCSITRRFRPRAGSAQQRTVSSTIALEKRSGAWVIVDIQA